METGFLPSMNGFHFPNSFADGPVINIHVPLVGNIGIGNASGGLCGGMSFAARDYWMLGMKPPTTKEVPEPVSPLFEYLAGRLIDSFDLPFGVMKFITWMVHTGDFGDKQLLEICHLLKQQSPTPLGLVRTHSLNPADLAHCHQVLAYGVTPTANSGWSVSIYDPNYPDRDDISLITEGNLHGTEEVRHSEDGVIRGFFLTHYPNLKQPPEIY